jgi:hypothetical protein
MKGSGSSKSLYSVCSFSSSQGAIEEDNGL